MTITIAYRPVTRTTRQPCYRRVKGASIIRVQYVTFVIPKCMCGVPIVPSQHDRGQLPPLSMRKERRVNEGKHQFDHRKIATRLEILLPSPLWDFGELCILPKSGFNVLLLSPAHPPTRVQHLQGRSIHFNMPPKRRTGAGNGRAAQNKQPAKRPALSLLDTDDTDDKKPPAPKWPVKRARKTQAQAQTRTRSGSHEDEDDNADDGDDGDVPEMRVANINR